MSSATKSSASSSSLSSMLPTYDWKKAVALGSVLGGFFLFHNWAEAHNKAKRSTSLTVGGVEDSSGIPDLCWLRGMPKLELHAHLHGSIPPRFLADIYKQQSSTSLFDGVISAKDEPNEIIKVILKEHKSFKECFAVFDVIHKVVTSRNVLERLTERVLLQFAEDNVVYLELRSTPRALPHSGHSREDYVHILCECIEQFYFKHPSHKQMEVRLILTIDNGHPVEEASETVDIAIQMREADPKCRVVGLDFAPKPLEGKHLDLYEPILQRGRDNGLKVTIHYAEYVNRKHQSHALEFAPDRVGHAVILEKLDWDTLLSRRIPIEMCPTSNMFTKAIGSYEEHPFRRFKEVGRDLGQIYPMIFCTDDCGIFGSELSDEWFKMCNAHAITKDFVRRMTLNAVDFTFLQSDTQKQQLKERIEKGFDELAED